MTPVDALPAAPADTPPSSGAVSRPARRGPSQHAAARAHEAFGAALQRAQDRTAVRTEQRPAKPATDREDSAVTAAAPATPPVEPTTTGAGQEPGTPVGAGSPESTAAAPAVLPTVVPAGPPAQTDTPAATAASTSAASVAPVAPTGRALATSTPELTGDVAAVPAAAPSTTGPNASAPATAAAVPGPVMPGSGDPGDAGSTGSSGQETATPPAPVATGGPGVADPAATTDATTSATEAAAPAAVAAPDVPATPPAGAQVVVAPTPAPVAVTPVSPAQAPGAPVHVPSPAEQIAPHVTALRSQPDGTHHLTLHLHPEDVGAVQVSVEITGRTVHVSLNGVDDSARDLLRQNLQDLRRELAGAGLEAGRLDVGSQHAGRRDPHGTGQQGGDRGAQGDVRRSDAGRDHHATPDHRDVARAAHQRGGVDVTV